MRTIMCLCVALLAVGLVGCGEASEADTSADLATPGSDYPPADTPRQLRLNEYQAKLTGDVDAFLACYETHELGSGLLATVFEFTQASDAYDRKFTETFEPGTPLPTPAPLNVADDIIFIEGDRAYMELASGQMLDMVRRDGVWRFDSMDLPRELSRKDQLGQASLRAMTVAYRDLTARMDTPGVTAEEIEGELARQVNTIARARAKEVGLMPAPDDFPRIEN